MAAFAELALSYPSDLQREASFTRDPEPLDQDMADRVLDVDQFTEVCTDGLHDDNDLAHAKVALLFGLICLLVPRLW